MRTVWGIVVVSLLGVGCSPRIGGSSLAECKQSWKKVARAAAATDSAGALSAVMSYAMASTPGDLGYRSSFDNSGRRLRYVDRPPLDTLAADAVLCEALTGTTPDLFVASRDSLERRVTQIAHRVSDSLYVAALIAARDSAQRIRDSLNGLVVEAARFSQSAGYYSREATLGLTLLNNTKHAISRAYFEGRVYTPGRTIPWIQQEFNHTIAGGLEPGERITRLLTPNAMQDEWTAVSVPRNAVFEVRVLKVEGADGEPLWGGVVFGKGDSLMLDSLSRAAR